KKSPARCWGAVSRPARAGLVAVAVLSGGIGARFVMQPGSVPGRNLNSRRPAFGPEPAASHGGQPLDGAAPADLAAARAAYERGRRKLGERGGAPRIRYDGWGAVGGGRGQPGRAGDPGLPA